MNERKPYSSDLTNEEWAHLRILLPQALGGGTDIRMAESLTTVEQRLRSLTQGE
jgi:hypothetical protein